MAKKIWLHWRWPDCQGFRHKTVKVPEWRNVSVVLREPSAEAWYLWREVLNGDGEDDDTLSVVAKTRRNLEAQTLFCDVLCDTDLQRVFTPDDREQVLAVYGQYMPGCCVRHWN